MTYRVIGLMSGSSLDGLDIIFTELEESSGKWNYQVQASTTISYNAYWQKALQGAPASSAYDYLQLHSAYGKFIGEQVNEFIETNNLHHMVQLIVSHGHTVFHQPKSGFTSQLGDGAVIAAATGINVISDLRAMDVALGGEGAPIVPVGEKLLFSNYDLLLNIGGIANISVRQEDTYIAFDICPANRVLNLLANQQGKAFDENGAMAAKGKVQEQLLHQLNDCNYYKQPIPKSLSNTFGTEEVWPLIQSYNITTEDALATYTEHIAVQVAGAVRMHLPITSQNKQVLITGGGAFNQHLTEKIQSHLLRLDITVFIPPDEVIQYKEALIMALLGVLRWREENTVLASVTGASRSSIGGAVWIGQEA